MSLERLIIQCGCGQRMRIPAESQSNVFKCVKCGAFVERSQVLPSRGRDSQETVDVTDTADAGEALATFFSEAGLISPEQLHQARVAWMRDKEKFFETLLRLKIVSSEQLHNCLSREPGTAAISLAHFTIDRNLTSLIPLETALKHWVLPIDKLGRSLTAAMVCPVDMEAIAEIEKLTSLRVRPMLCTMDDFARAIKHHYRVADEDMGEGVVSNKALLMRETPGEKTQNLVADDAQKIRKALLGLECLPIPAKVMNQVDAVVGVEAEGLRQVICVAGTSPRFTVKLLATANSVAFGLPGNVESIPMAVGLLGEQAVALLAANAPKLPASEERQWFFLTRFSRHCAQIAAVLALELGRVIPNAAYCAGLLHAIGSFALGGVAPEENRKIDPRLVGAKRNQAEEALFGVGHVEAGLLLCKSWNIPQSLWEPISNYLTPEKAANYSDMAHLIFVAAHLAGPDGEINTEGMAACARSFAALGIAPDVALNALNTAASGAVGV